MDVLLPRKILLVDRSENLVKRLAERFANCPAVQAAAGGLFSAPGRCDRQSGKQLRHSWTAASISPSAMNWGFAVHERLQAIIIDKYHREMPVGSAEIVETGHKLWPSMVAAPTMRIPEPVPYTLNAYLAFREILVAVENFNKSHGRRAIDSLLCCGLGAGIGRINPSRCAMHMRAAYHLVSRPSRIPNYQGIHDMHKALMQMLRHIGMGEGL